MVGGDIKYKSFLGAYKTRILKGYSESVKQ